MHPSWPVILLLPAMALARAIGPDPAIPIAMIPSLTSPTVDFADEIPDTPQPSAASPSPSPRPLLALHMWNFTVVRDMATGNMSSISFSLSRVDEDGVVGNETITGNNGDVPKLHPKTNPILCESSAPTIYTSQAIPCTDASYQWHLLPNSTNTYDANTKTTPETRPRPYLSLSHNTTCLTTDEFQAPEWACRPAGFDGAAQQSSGNERCVQTIQPTIINLE